MLSSSSSKTSGLGGGGRVAPRTSTTEWDKAAKQLGALQTIVDQLLPLFNLKVQLIVQNDMVYAVDQSICDVS